MKSPKEKKHRRDGIVVRAFASQLVDLGFIPEVESYQKTLKYSSLPPPLCGRPVVYPYFTGLQL